MEINRIRVSGFKSFSDPIELAIEGGLTGVVGPNGCGKSNIVEALRWAMGESSAKGLRGDEMDDVIFNGSGGRAAHDVAEVRLKLRGRAEALAHLVGSEDLEVARKIARGVGSTYRINGKEARARDVQLLFADAGAGSRSPAIVGQGQIGFIVDAKPGDRRKLLEDAAGIGGLQTRRREAELKLEAAAANLQRVLDLLAAQEQRLGELRKQSRQAERYRKLAAELRRAETLLLLARHEAAGAALRAADGLVQATTAALEQQRKTAGGLRRGRYAAGEGLPGLRQRAVAAGEQAAALRERLVGLRAAAEREAAHLELLERQQAEAVADRERAQRQVTELGLGRDAAGTELAALTEEAASLDRALHAAEPAAEAARRDLAQAQAQAHAAVAEAAAATAQLEAVAQRQAALVARGDVLAAERAALPSPDAAQAAAAQAEGAVGRCEDALAAARAALAAAEAELQRLEPLLEAQRAAHLAAERQLTTARQAVAAAEQERRAAQAEAAALANRRAGQARQAERLAERRRGHRARAEALARSRGEADTSARQAELAAAESELQAADVVLDQARAEVGACEQGRSEAAEGLRELRRSADALAAEIRVLESLVRERPAGGVLDRLEVPEDLTMAVAAALGDDLLAGTEPDAPSHWREIVGEAGTALPEGVPSLLGLIAAPEALHRRLAQVGVCAAEDGAALQPRLAQGQRLVSREGGLWRWDGFVRDGAAEDGGVARVRHELRLHAAREEVVGLERGLGLATETRAAREAALAAARSTLAAAEVRWRRADAGQLQARQRLQAAAQLAERLAGETERLAEEERGLAQEERELVAERAELDRCCGELADLARLEAGLEQSRAGQAAAERALRLAVDQVRQIAQDRERAAMALRGRRAAMDAAQAALDQARAAAEGAVRHAAELRAAHATRATALAAEEAGLAQAMAEVAAEAAAAATARQERQAARQAAEAAHGAAEQRAQVATHELAGLRAAAGQAGQRAGSLRASLADLTARLGTATEDAAALAQRAGRQTAALAQARAERRCDPAELERLDGEAVAAETAAAAARAAQSEGEAELARLERELEQADGAAGDLRERLAVAQTERGHAVEALAAARAAVEERLQQPPAALLADAELKAAVAAASLPPLEAEVGRLRTARDRLGPVNLRAEVEVGELETEIGETRAREAELQAAIGRLRSAIGTLDKEGRERLQTAFDAVDGHFRRLFQQLFGGGKAQLRLVGADDPLHAGLELEASPPGKKLTSISLLSGGEKTLTALALVFGFFLAQPSPLCVLDEVDAPLDDANVDRFVALMQEIAAGTGTRFLVVTHHPLTMARMDRLYGVTMAERGVSRLVSVALEEALELRATA
ncbi:MAG: AAA family ATPase [Geminicoccaceae bacterium]